MPQTGSGHQARRDGYSFAGCGLVALPEQRRPDLVVGLDLKAGAGLLSWLHSIAYRQFLQHLRKHSRQHVVPEPPDAGHDPRAAVDAEYLAPRLLAEASPPERACLTLAYAAGMSHAEISGVTGLPVGTVKSHITRGKQKLQNWLKQNDHSSPPETLSHKEVRGA